MYFKGEDFKYFFNGESKTREEIEQLVDYNTTVGIKGLDVFYSSPKITTSKADISPEYEKRIHFIQKLLEEAEEHQKQNGGILQGVEFPFDLCDKSEDEGHYNSELERQEQKIFKDWECTNLGVLQGATKADWIDFIGNSMKRGKVINYTQEDILEAEKKSESLGKKEDGVKTNKNKPQLSILFTQFPEALKAIAMCSEYGHLKYKDTDFDYLNYQRVEGGSKTYADAGLRHRLYKKSTSDLESGLPHAYHVAWNALAELEIYIKESFAVSK